MDNAVRPSVFTFGNAVLDEEGKVQGKLLTSIKLNRYGELFKHSSFLQGSFVGIADHREEAIRIGEACCGGKSGTGWERTTA